MEIIIGLLIYLIIGVFVLLKYYEGKKGTWEGYFIPVFIFSPVVLGIMIIKQVFFTKWF